MSSVIDNYHNVQQDILETFVDRGQLRRLAEPTLLPNGKRILGLKLNHPRQLALMHALVRFSHLAAQNTFAASEIYADTLAALDVSSKDYSLASIFQNFVPRDSSRKFRGRVAIVCRAKATPSASFS